MKVKLLEITSPIQDFALLSSVYAEKEQEIDFLHDHAGAILCTASFCAKELSEHLKRTEHDLCCVLQESPSGKNPSITLECTADVPSDGSFSFIVTGKDQLIIRAGSRNGLVNGTYEFLRLQGWEWLEPGINGEFAPQDHEIIFPAQSKEYTPSFKYRAFYFEYPSQASLEFLMWMARNRMNVFGSFPALKATAQKLGMYLLSGGHILTTMMKPDRLTPSGKTLLEEHPSWYGTRGDGEALTAENACRTQFCCSNEELMDYLADNLIRMLNHEWLGTDILEVSGFDTWGSTCMCPACKVLSDSDKYMRFMSSMRERLNKAYEKGILQHNPMLNTWAYEGTATMEAPTHIPENMKEAQDNCIAFVINRCYKHPMGTSPVCPDNAKYANTVKAWGKFADQMTLWAGEYYNVSRHEDLTLLFTENMTKSMQFYYEAGARGATYMHTPIINWSVRGITQNLHARLSWDMTMDVDAFCRKYLLLRYGKYAHIAEEACKEIEKASSDVAEWRAWQKSILGRFGYFAATADSSRALPQRHYKDNADVIRGGKKIQRSYRKAQRLLQGIYDELFRDAPSNLQRSLAVNPEEQAQQLSLQRRLQFLECDLRMLHYTLDVIQIMTTCAEAYDAHFRKDQETLEKLYPKLEKLAKKMALYTESVHYRAAVSHFKTPSALLRSQCGPMIHLLKGLCKAGSPKSER